MNHCVTRVMGEPKDYTGAKVGMWLFLFTELLFFGGLFIVYSVYRFKYSSGFHEASQELDIVIGIVNTIILITSSLSMVLSVSLLKSGKNIASMVSLIITILLGIFFLVNKYFEWGSKIAHGIYPGSPALADAEGGYGLFYSLYFTMTGFHSLHVFAGVLVLSVIFIMMKTGKIDVYDFVKLENAGLYWHFVDIVWIYLFPLFYLIT